MRKTKRQGKTSTRGPLADIRKALDGDMAAGLLDVSEAITDHPVIPTGVRAIDALIRIGGWPRGSGFLERNRAAAKIVQDFRDTFGAMGDSS